MNSYPSVLQECISGLLELIFYPLHNQNAVPAVNRDPSKDFSQAVPEAPPGCKLKINKILKCIVFCLSIEHMSKAM